MGDHASNPDPRDPDHGTPRQGIRNVGGHGSDTHPGALVEALNGDRDCESK
jgi:hypothetical protein